MTSKARVLFVWSFEDPVTSTKHDAFRLTLHEIHERIKMFVLVKKNTEKRYG